MLNSIPYCLFRRALLLTKGSETKPSYCLKLSACDIVTSKFLSSQQSSDRESSTELVATTPRGILRKEFSKYFDSDGKFITRITYVDFIYQALDKMKELGLERNLEAYKELLRVFPPGKYHRKSLFDIGVFHEPQQACVLELLCRMENNLVKPDKEIEHLVNLAFGKHSDVWLKVVRMNYWTMKARNIDPHPLPEVLPKKPHELAKVALLRMIDDPKTSVIVTTTSTVPDAVDDTWIVYSQSPDQKSIIEKLDEKSILYIEGSLRTYVGRDFLSYCVLKVYDDEETARKKNQVIEPTYNYNRLKVKFYGKEVDEKLKEPEERYRVDDGYILAIGMTGTSSNDSIASWLKHMQKRIPNLAKLNVVFKLNEPSQD